MGEGQDNLESRVQDSGLLGDITNSSLDYRRRWFFLVNNTQEGTQKLVPATEEENVIGNKNIIIKRRLYLKEIIEGNLPLLVAKQYAETHPSPSMAKFIGGIVEGKHGSFLVMRHPTETRSVPSSSMVGFLPQALPQADAVYSLDGRNDWFGGPHEYIANHFKVGGTTLLAARPSPDRWALYSEDGKADWFGGPHARYLGCVEGIKPVYVDGQPLIAAQHEQGGLWSLYDVQGKISDLFGGSKHHIKQVVSIRGELFMVASPSKRGGEVVIDREGEFRFGGMHSEVEGFNFVNGGVGIFAQHPYHDGIFSREGFYWSRHSRLPLHTLLDFSDSTEHDGAATGSSANQGRLFTEIEGLDLHEALLLKRTTTYQAVISWLSDRTHTKSRAIHWDIVQTLSEAGLADHSLRVFGKCPEDVIDALALCAAKERMESSFHRPHLEDWRDPIQALRYTVFSNSYLVDCWVQLVEAYSNHWQGRVDLQESIDIASYWNEECYGNEGDSHFLAALRSFKSFLDRVNNNAEDPDRMSLGEIMECNNIDIPGYTIHKKVGEGADGRVYQAKHDWFGSVKVKIFKDPEDKIKEAMEKEGVTLEERIQRRIAGFDSKVRDYRSIARLYDVGRCTDPVTGKETIYITSDYVDGGAIERKDSHGDYTIRPDITPDVAMEIFPRVLNALHVIHQAGLVLRDVKLRNTLASYDHKTVYIDDLETIAGIEDVKSGDRLTEGSDRYAAPEVLCDIRTASQGTDLYSAVVGLLYMITGKPDLMVGINSLSDKEEYTRRLNEMLAQNGIPERQQEFFRTALAYNPEERYSTAIAIANDHLMFFFPDVSAQLQMRVIKDVLDSKSEAFLSVDLLHNRAIDS